MSRAKRVALVTVFIVSMWIPYRVDATRNLSTSKDYTAQSNQFQRPLTLSQIEELIANRTRDAAIAIEIERRGIAFEPTSQELERLQIKGAGPKTIKALKSVRPKTEGNQSMSTKSQPKLWITYAWKNNAGGDFDFLVQELRKAGIDVRFDKIELIPGQRLWEQIAARIEDPQLDGWAILLTKESIESEACREELAYALDRALSPQGRNFPLMGLLHQVSISDSKIPASLRARLCVDLRNPDWTKEVRAGLERRPPSTANPETVNLRGQVHNAYLGNPNLRAVEFVPRFGEIRYWRIAYPSDGPQPVKMGIGPAGGGGVSGTLESFVEGTVDINGMHMKFFGAGNALTPSTAAYIVFQQKFPVHFAFGYADRPDGNPPLWQPVTLR